VAAFVEGVSNGTTGTGTVSVNITTAAGNTLVVGAYANNNSTNPTFTINGSYKVVSSGNIGGTEGIQMWVSSAPCASETVTITVECNETSTNQSLCLIAFELSGATQNIPDVWTHWGSVSSSTEWSAWHDITTTASNQVIIVAVGSDYEMFAPTGWSAYRRIDTNGKFMMAYKVQSSASTVGNVLGTLDGSPTARDYFSILTAFGDVGWGGSARVQFIGI
jgi:hypothetical protein